MSGIEETMPIVMTKPKRGQEMVTTPINEELYHEGYLDGKKYYIPDSNLEAMKDTINLKMRLRKSTRYRHQTSYELADYDHFKQKLNKLITKIDDVSTSSSENVMPIDKESRGSHSIYDEKEENDDVSTSSSENLMPIDKEIRGSYSIYDEKVENDDSIESEIEKSDGKDTNLDSDIESSDIKDGKSEQSETESDKHKDEDDGVYFYKNKNYRTSSISKEYEKKISNEMNSEKDSLTPEDVKSFNKIDQVNEYKRKHPENKAVDDKTLQNIGSDSEGSDIEYSDHDNCIPKLTKCKKTNSVTSTVIEECKNKHLTNKEDINEKYLQTRESENKVFKEKDDMEEPYDIVKNGVKDLKLKNLKKDKCDNNESKVEGKDIDFTNNNSITKKAKSKTINGETSEDELVGNFMGPKLYKCKKTNSATSSVKGENDDCKNKHLTNKQDINEKYIQIRESESQGFKEKNDKEEPYDIEENGVKGLKLKNLKKDKCDNNESKVEGKDIDFTNNNSITKKAKSKTINGKTSEDELVGNFMGPKLSKCKKTNSATSTVKDENDDCKNKHLTNKQDTNEKYLLIRESESEGFKEKDDEEEPYDIEENGVKDFKLKNIKKDKCGNYESKGKDIDFTNNNSITKKVKSKTINGKTSEEELVGNCMGPKLSNCKKTNSATSTIKDENVDCKNKHLTNKQDINEKYLQIRESESEGFKEKDYEEEPYDIEENGVEDFKLKNIKKDKCGNDGSKGKDIDFTNNKSMKKVKNKTINDKTSEDELVGEINESDKSISKHPAECYDFDGAKHQNEQSDSKSDNIENVRDNNFINNESNSKFHNSFTPKNRYLAPEVVESYNKEPKNKHSENKNLNQNILRNEESVNRDHVIKNGEEEKYEIDADKEDKIEYLKNANSRTQTFESNSVISKEDSIKLDNEQFTTKPLIEPEEICGNKYRKDEVKYFQNDTYRTTETIESNSVIPNEDCIKLDNIEQLETNPLLAKGSPFKSYTGSVKEPLQDSFEPERNKSSPNEERFRFLISGHLQKGSQPIYIIQEYEGGNSIFQNQTADFFSKKSEAGTDILISGKFYKENILKESENKQAFLNIEPNKIDINPETSKIYHNFFEETLSMPSIDLVVNGKFIKNDNKFTPFFRFKVKSKFSETKI